MDRPSSPASNSPSVTTSPPSSPAPSDPDLELQQQHQQHQQQQQQQLMQQQQQQRQKKKVQRKKRKPAAAGLDEEPQLPNAQGEPTRKKKPKTAKRGNKEGSSKGERTSSTTAAVAEASSGTAITTAAAAIVKKPRKQSATKRATHGTTSASGGAAVDRSEASSPAQSIVHDQMRKALEEDQYSAVGSIVDTDSDSDDHEFMIKGRPVRLDRNAIMSAMRKRLWMERVAASGAGANASSNAAANNNNGNNHHSNNSNSGMDDDDMDDDTDHRRGGGGGGRKKKKKKGKRKDDGSSTGMGATGSDDDPRSVGGDNWSSVGPDGMDLDDPTLDELERDEGSIFGQTTGNSNSIWVECDKCKKWRRLRGVVDEKKLPSKWYCSMNKNDPERARCSAPEEEYDTTNTPESAADARTRKHLRVWVRRLQCNEAYESRQPTLTRGKKRAAATNSKEPYEWVRCCNPSCGKWRAILRIMDAKNNVMDRTTDGEWYCVMNTWDEKTASCAAPQENLPAVGCPPWVMQDE